MLSSSRPVLDTYLAKRSYRGIANSTANHRILLQVTSVVVVRIQS